MSRQDYVNISREELENWLDSKFGSWSRDRSTAGIYFIHLSDRVAVKLSSTQKGSGSNVAKGRASMNLSLVSLVDGSLLNRKARDRKYFQRTKNWKTTWKKGIDYWINVYEQKEDFYEKIADRKGYKAKWLGLIDALPNGGSDAQLVKSRNELEGGGVLWPNQEQYILDLTAQAQSRSRSMRQEQSTVLDVEKLRDMYRKARSQGDRDAMDTIKRLGIASNRGKKPSQQDLKDYKRIRLSLGV